MTDIKPKRPLDRDLLRRAVNYYRFEFTEENYEELQEWECFSHPSLELHECNSRVKLPGKRDCKFCNHNIDKPCDIACDLQTFCLAVYAWRLGVGGEDFDKALQRNLYKKTPDDLYDEVINNLSGIPTSEVSSEVEEDGDEDLEEVKSERMYTVSEAAKVKKCSYTTIYTAISNNKLEAEKIGDKTKIKESVLKDFVVNTRRSKKNGR